MLRIIVSLICVVSVLALTQCNKKPGVTCESLIKHGLQLMEKEGGMSKDIAKSVDLAKAVKNCNNADLKTNAKDVDCFMKATSTKTFDKCGKAAEIFGKATSSAMK